MGGEGGRSEVGQVESERHLWEQGGIGHAGQTGGGGALGVSWWCFCETVDKMFQSTEQVAKLRTGMRADNLQEIQQQASKPRTGETVDNR